MMSRETVKYNGQVRGADVSVRDGVLRIRVLAPNTAQFPDSVIEIDLSAIPEPS